MDKKQKTEMQGGMFLQGLRCFSGYARRMAKLGRVLSFALVEGDSYFEKELSLEFESGARGHLTLTRWHEDLPLPSEDGLKAVLLGKKVLVSFLEEQNLHFHASLNSLHVVVGNCGGNVWGADSTGWLPSVGIITPEEVRKGARWVWEGGI